MLREGWSEVTIVDSAPMPSCALAPSQQAYMDICTAIENLAALTRGDMARGSFVAADHGREQMYLLVRQLGPALVDVIEEHGGPTENCRYCGDIVAVCRCEDDDIPFAEEA